MPLSQIIEALIVVTGLFEEADQKRTMVSRVPCKAGTGSTLPLNREVEQFKAVCGDVLTHQLPTDLSATSARQLSLQTAQ